MFTDIRCQSIGDISFNQGQGFIWLRLGTRSGRLALICSPGNLTIVTTLQFFEFIVAMDSINSQSLVLPAVLALFGIFNPISSFKAVSRRTFGKWRYVVYPAFVLSHGVAAAFDPLLIVLLSVVFPGALNTLLETYYSIFGKANPPPRLLGINELEGALSFIKGRNPTITEFVLVMENLFGFETAYDALTSPYVRLSEDGTLKCVEPKEPDAKIL